MIKLIIFDRDDTLNIDVGFTYKLEDLKLVKNAKKVCNFIKQKNLLYAVATNQSGIGENYYTEKDMQLFNKALFGKLGLDYSHNKIAFCPHPRVMHPRCACRKPSPFLLLKLCKNFNILPKETIFIGDRDSDKECADRAGCYFIDIDVRKVHDETTEKINHIQNCLLYDHK